MDEAASVNSQVHDRQEQDPFWRYYGIRLERLHLLLACAMLKHPSLQTGDLSLFFTGSPVEEAVLSGSDRQLTLALRSAERELQKEAERQADAAHPFLSLSAAFELTPFEEDALFATLAPYLDAMNGKLYGLLLGRDEVVQPNMEVLSALFEADGDGRIAIRDTFSKHRSFAHYLFRPFDADEDPWFTPLSLPEDVLAELLGLETVSASSIEMAVYHDQELHDRVIHEAVHDQLLHAGRFFAEDSGTEDTLFIQLKGEAGSGRLFHMRHFADAFGMEARTLDAALLKEDPERFRDMLTTLFRSAIVSDAVIMIRHLDALFDKDTHHLNAVAKKALTEELRHYAGLVFVSTAADWRDAFPGSGKVTISIPMPDERERKALWTSISEAVAFTPDVDWDMLAGAFRLSPGSVRAVLTRAKEQRALDPSVPDVTLLHEACYDQVEHRLSEKGDRLTIKGRWDDLILPESQKNMLRQACNQMKYRTKVFGEWGFADKLSYGKGLSMLFSGPPGTGKTMGAEVVAGELGLHIYKIDLSRVVSKYIGETEKSLQAIFDEAEKSHAILFFDEMDALFGKRSEVKDAKDKYANIEVSFLLQKMEQYEGITILATNLLQNIDEAFLRRIQFIIHFPFPKARERERLWQSIFPAALPVEEDVDFREIAETLEIAGGNIKNIAVAAAFLAASEGRAVAMRHIVKAAMQEAKKSGKVIQVEDWAAFLTEEVEEDGPFNGDR